MKKVFLLLTLIAMTFSAWGATTVTKTVSQLKSSSTLVTGTNTYFALDNVISVSSVSGSARLDNNTSYLRYFQWTEKGYGSMVFKAKAGYVITSIKLKYTQAKAGTVPCVYWYNDNSKVPVCDTLANNVARGFYSNQVVIFIGNTITTGTTVNNGEIQVTEFSVAYEQATVDRMYTKSTMDLGMQYSWDGADATGYCPLDVDLNDILSVHSDKNTFKFYWSSRAFHCYQWGGNKFWFNTRNGATIKNIRVYYYVQSGDGVLCLSENYGTDGKSIPSNKQIASGQTVAVNGTSVSFNCGSKSAINNAQIRVTGFQIEYTDGNSQMETYTNLTDVSSSSEKKYTGDNGYKWKVKNFAHRDSCAMYDYLGTRLFYNGYIASDEAIEGGIKNVSFEWRLAKATNGGTVISEPTKFTVQAGSTSDVCTQTEYIRTAGHHMTYNHAFNVKSNAAFSINVGAQESTAQAQPIFGPVTITPYLLYTKKSVTIQAKNCANFKYTNTALINNTAGEDGGNVVYSVSGTNADKIASIDSSTGEVTIKGEGTVTVKAEWNNKQVSTSYQLTIQLETPDIKFDSATVNKTVGNQPYTQPLTLNKPISGNVTYSIIGHAGATIDPASGEVTFTEAGEYTIKGELAQTLPYKAGSATYKLVVSSKPDENVHILSSSITALKANLKWPAAPSAGTPYSNIALDDVLTLSSGKHLCEDVYGTGKIDHLRYYQKYAPDHFTIQATTGAIIQTINLKYDSDNSGVLSKKKGTSLTADDKYISGETYAVDDNAFTCYFGNASTGDDGRANLTDYVIKYFKPTEGVAVTKTAADLGKDSGLEHSICYQDLVLNSAIKLHAEKSETTLRYISDADGERFHCYQGSGYIELQARKGATIHYAKITYRNANNGVLTKYWGTDGKNIPTVDRIASDSVLYVNAQTLRLYIGSTGTNTNAQCHITKIYVNYTDKDEMVVENFNKCGKTSSESEETVAGIDGKYTWKISKFSRSVADRMYYNQSIKLSQNGKISTNYTGGFKEVAFDWKPSTNAAIDFTVMAGDSSWHIEKAAMGGTYAINFRKTALKSNGVFSITNNGATPVEIGYITLTPYLLYTKTSDEIYAKDYVEAEFKYKNENLVVNTTSKVTYAVSGENADKIASVDDKGVVSILGDGTVTVTASAEGASTSYQLTIHLEDANVKFANDKKNVTKYLWESPYTQTASKDTEAALKYTITGGQGGAVIDSVSGEVSMSCGGVYTITAAAPQTLPYKAGQDDYTLTVLDKKTVVGNVPTLATQYGWVSGNDNSSCYTYFKLDDKISLSTEVYNAKYLKNGTENCLRYYQGSKNGAFTIRGKAGVIIKTIKLTYYYGTVVRTAGTDVSDANKITSGKSYAVDANSITLYVAQNGNNQARITDFEVTYFCPGEGVAVTKQMIDLKKQYGYQNNQCPQSVALNNVISMNVYADGTQKYLDNGNQFRYYQGTGGGKITFKAREGAKIHYLKITYSIIDNGVLNKTGNIDNVPVTDRIASDSILYVNANSIDLYVGRTTNSGNKGQVRISKVYVNYTDANASVETFEKCSVANTINSTNVEGIDNAYKWKLTNYNMDSTHHIYYDQSIMLRTNNTSKIETVDAEGGIKEVSFDWFVNTPSKQSKFTVKVGDMTDAVDSAAMKDGSYKITYTKQCNKKKNVDFSITMATGDDTYTYMEFGHISLTPYLLYKTKEANTSVGVPFKNTDILDNRDNATAISYSVDGGVADVADDGTITPATPGDLTVTATWGEVSTTYTLHVSGALILDEKENNNAKIAACAGQEIGVSLVRTLAAGKYNTFCVPFNITRSDLASVLKTEITSLATIDENSTATFDSEKKNLDIAAKELDDNDEVEAGKPYLLKIASEVVNPEFENVTIGAANDSIVSKDKTVKFYGITSPYPIPDDNRYLFMSNNKLNWNNTGKTTNMNGLRSYFYVPGMQNPNGVSARLVFHQPQTPTEVNNVNANVNANRKMIINNQLIIIRNGVLYNANGQMLKIAK